MGGAARLKDSFEKAASLPLGPAASPEEDRGLSFLVPSCSYSGGACFAPLAMTF